MDPIVHACRGGASDRMAQQAKPQYHKIVSNIPKKCKHQYRILRQQNVLCSENLLLLNVFFQHSIFNFFLSITNEFCEKIVLNSLFFFIFFIVTQWFFLKIVCGKEFMSSYQPNYWILGRSQKMKFSTSKTTWILKQN